MIIPHITQTLQKQEDPYSPETAHYTAQGGLGKNAVSLRFDSYPESLTITAALLLKDTDAKNAAFVQKTLQAKGFTVKLDAETRSHESRAIIQDVQRNSVIPLITALATIPETEGGISRYAAGGIIEHELTRTGQTPSQANLLTLHAEPIATRSKHGLADKPGVIPPGGRPYYMDGVIHHPLSAVMYFKENEGNIAQTTRIGACATGDEAEIISALKEAGIQTAERDSASLKSQQSMGELLKRAGMGNKTPLFHEGQSDIVAHSTAPEVMRALSDKGLVPASIAQEIEDKAAILYNSRLVRIKDQQGSEKGR